MSRLLALSAVAALALAGCGGGDDGGGSATPPATTATTATTASEANTLESAEIGFTFTYPKEWEETSEGGKVLAAVTPTPGDAQNGIKVRKTSDQELPFASYSGQIAAQFEDQLGTKVDVATETIGGTDMGVMTWSTKGLHSASYFFTASGRTWQVECLSTAEHRDDVDSACELAVGSIEPR